MELSVLADLYGDKSLEQALLTLTALGIQTVEARQAFESLAPILIQEENPATMSWA